MHEYTFDQVFVDYWKMMMRANGGSREADGDTPTFGYQQGFVNSIVIFSVLVEERE